MGVYALPVDAWTHANDLRDRLTRALHEPSGIVFGDGLDAPPTGIEFTPDLSAEEEATLEQTLKEIMAQNKS